MPNTLEKGPLSGSIKNQNTWKLNELPWYAYLGMAGVGAMGLYALSIIFQVYPPLIRNHEVVREELREGAQRGTKYVAEQTDRGVNYAAEQAHDGVNGVTHGFVEFVSDYWLHLGVFVAALGVGGVGIYLINKHVQNHIHDKNNPIFKPSFHSSGSKD